MKITVKRVYDLPAKADGLRVLVDRVWPRGLTRSEVRIDLWLRGLAPSTALRKWFNHDPAKWDDFRTRYFRELAGRGKEFLELLDRAGDQPVTLLFGAREERFNNAVALQEYLETILQPVGSRR